MNSRERVYAALRRQPVDRVPIFMWFHPGTAMRLSRELEIPVDRVAEAMGNDVHQAWVGNNQAMEGVTHAHDGETHVDDWGVEWIKEGPFNQIKRSPLELKRDFGKHLAFMGGVDTQELLPRGSVDAVRRTTVRLLEGMTAGGGYILAASHTIPPETPLANIFALYAAAGVNETEIRDRAANLRKQRQ